MVKKQDQKENIPAAPKKRKKHPIRRALFIVLVILLLLLGYLYIQQMLLDLEAIAFVSAQQTAAAVVNEEIVDLSTNTPDRIPTSERSINTTPTSGMDNDEFMHTATVAAQLTSIAIFQMTATP